MRQQLRARIRDLRAFQRNWQGFPYSFEGRARKWMPDFCFANGVFVEIKGYTSRQVEAKFAAFPHPLMVFHRDTLQAAFEYVVANYGRKFIEMYE